MIGSRVLIYGSSTCLYVTTVVFRAIQGTITPMEFLEVTVIAVIFLAYWEEFLFDEETTE